MDSAILSDIKNALGDAEIMGDSFDLQLLNLIQVALLPLSQIGCIKPLMNIDGDTTWEDIIKEPESSVFSKEDAANAFFDIKTYIYLSVKVLFDPPPSTIVSIMEERKKESLWRIEVAYHD